MKKRAVAILANSLTKGGAERVISRISKPLSECYKIYIFLLDTKNMAYECSGKVLNVGGKCNNYLGKVAYSIGLINKYIKEKDIECVISFLDVPNLINVLGIHNCKRIISLRCAYDSKMYKGLNNRIKLGLCKHFFKNADAVIPVSKALGKFSVEYFSLKKEKVKVIENAYDVEDIIMKSNEEVEKEVLKFITRHRTSIAVGRLDEQKGYPFLLQCFAKVCKNEKDAGLIILGEGYLHDKLENMAAELGIKDRVLFLGIRDNPFAYISRSQVYVSASLYEGFPNALVEAMACGIPVIQTDCMTGPREILSDVYIEKNIDEAEYAEYGILMPDFYRADMLRVELDKLIEIFSHNWEKVLRDKELQKKYGKAAQQRARYYTMDECVRKYCEVINKVLDS